MDDTTIEEMAEEIRAARRRQRPRWTNPVSPLQAARYERRQSGKQVIMAIRSICPGHKPGQSCKIDTSKLSDYECGNRRPGLEHIEAFARLYQRSPEALGLINWRDEPSTDEPGISTNGKGPDGDRAKEQSLVRLLSETTALTAATTQLLQATLDQRTPSDVLPEPEDGQPQPADGQEA